MKKIVLLLAVFVIALPALVTASEEESDVAGSLEGVVGVLPVWPYLLLFAVLFLLFETWLVGHGLRRSHVSR